MNEPNDNLDALLRQVPPQPAPSWFEQRLMARLRREEARAGLHAWMGRLWTGWKLAVPCAAVAFLAVGIFWVKLQGPAPGPAPGLTQEELNRTLDAFVAYTEQDQSWNLVY